LITWTPKHVLGHQDLHNPGDIDYWAALNIKMDAMAKEYWKETKALGAAPQSTPDRSQTKDGLFGAADIS
jgi:hypothetical protein